MGKLGWVAFGLLSIVVVGVGASEFKAKDDSAKLDEIKALLTEQIRVQRIDVHKRLHKHNLAASCDLAEKCERMDNFVPIHLVEVEINGLKHPFSERCTVPGGCKKAEEAWKTEAAERQKK